MQEGTTASVSFPSLSAKDVLTEVLREGAQQMLVTAIEAEVTDWIESHAHLKNEQGHRQVVRNGYLPERKITTGVGTVPVRQPRVHDRRPEGEKEKFTSKILPPYLRKTKSIEDLVPWLYLKGISSGDFPQALASLLGPDAAGLSATTVTRLKSHWEDEYSDWSKRRLEGKLGRQRTPSSMSLMMPGMTASVLGSTMSFDRFGAVIHSSTQLFRWIR